MLAIVLVGGEGTRLRPLTYDTPKQMLPIVGRPMISRVLDWLAANGVDRAVLSLGYRPEAFAAAFANEHPSIEVRLVAEPEPRDTAGAVRFAADEIGVDETFVVLNGDVMTDFDLGPLVSLHRRVGAEASIHLTPVADPSAFGVVDLDPTGKVRAFIEKPPPGTAPSNLVNAGTYVLEPSVLGRIEPGGRVSIERETFPRLVADGKLYALPSDAYWLDSGTPAQYLQAQLDILRGARPHVLPPPGRVVRPGVVVAADAHVGGDLGDSVVVLDGAVVEDGAQVEESVVGPGARVCGGAVVRRSVLFAGAVVDKAAVVEDSILGRGARVGAGASLRATSVIGTDVEVPAGEALGGARVPQ